MLHLVVFAMMFFKEYNYTNIFSWLAQGSILTVVRSSETYGQVSKITRFKAQIFFFNFSPVNVPVFWMFTSHSAIPCCSKQKINILLTSFRCTYDNLYGTLRSKEFAGSIFLSRPLTYNSNMQTRQDSCSLAAHEFRKMWPYFDKVSSPPQNKKGEF